MEERSLVGQQEVGMPAKQPNAPALTLSLHWTLVVSL